MQVLCGLQVLFLLFNCQTPVSPESAIVRSLSLLTDISAVSLDEKNADNIKRITSMIS